MLPEGDANPVGWPQSQLRTAGCPSTPALPPKLPTSLRLPPPTVAVSQEKGTGGCVGVRPQAADPCGCTHPQVPQQFQQTGAVVIVHVGAGCGDACASTLSLEGVSPPSPLFSPPPESSSGWHESFRSQGSQPGGLMALGAATATSGVKLQPSPQSPGASIPGAGPGRGGSREWAEAGQGVGNGRDQGTPPPQPPMWSRGTCEQGWWCARDSVGL